jgi:hypothetical protein
LLPLGERPSPDQDATIGAWIIHVPGAHILWDHWMVSVVHLRPLEGVKPALKRCPEATHEFMILALNPEERLPSSLVVGNEFQVRYLTPIDVVEQFTAADDATADRILEDAVYAIVNGFASPDQDFRSWWHRAIADTAAHYNDGTHGVRRQ